MGWSDASTRWIHGTRRVDARQCPVESPPTSWACIAPGDTIGPIVVVGSVPRACMRVRWHRAYKQAPIKSPTRVGGRSAATRLAGRDRGAGAGPPRRVEGAGRRGRSHAARAGTRYSAAASTWSNRPAAIRSARATPGRRPRAGRSERGLGLARGDRTRSTPRPIRGPRAPACGVPAQSSSASPRPTPGASKHPIGG